MNLPNRVKVLFYRFFGEKRKYIRVPISVKVTRMESGSFSYSQSTNLSLGGMFLKSDEPLEKGHTLDLQFSLPNPVKRDIRVQAEVVRIQKSNPEDSFPSGMGIRFINLSDQDKEAIKDFIKIKT